MEQNEIKACGTASYADMQLAARAGVDAAGIIWHPGEQRGATVGSSYAIALSESAPEDLDVVLLPRVTDELSISAMCRRMRPDRLQLGEKEDLKLLKALRSMLDIPIAQVIHVGTDEAAVEQAERFLYFADIIHIDTAGDRPGGTGQTHDLSISKEIVKLAHDAGKPAIIAGGLTAEYVVEAINTTKPDGVDVQTYIKDGFGHHDPGKLNLFVQTARTAFSAMRSMEQAA
ncbi:MAG TPA: phosphoribosylanthranilate isomerase [Candidatus Saccharimonadales bacterium]|nr:phosphoribosylanthranilate isomerase [Candidatus Saccharimonadales bacterium]